MASETEATSTCRKPASRAISSRVGFEFTGWGLGRDGPLAESAPVTNPMTTRTLAIRPGLAQQNNLSIAPSWMYICLLNLKLQPACCWGVNSAARDRSVLNGG